MVYFLCVWSYFFYELMHLNVLQASDQNFYWGPLQFWSGYRSFQGTLKGFFGANKGKDTFLIETSNAMYMQIIYIFFNLIHMTNYTCPIAWKGMDHYLKWINWYSDTCVLLKVLNVHVYLHCICRLQFDTIFTWHTHTYALVSLTGVCRGRQPGPLPWGERTGYQTGPGRETQNSDVCARNSRTSRNSRGHAGLGPLTNWNWLTKSVNLCKMFNV